MIVISLALVIAAAVSLFIGLVVVTDTLVFIFAAIGLCLVSLVLLWLGTRSRSSAGPATSPSTPVYGGGARSGGSTTPARGVDADDLDELTSAEGATVVRKTAARDRAAARVEEGAAPTRGDRPDESTPPAPPEDTTPTDLLGAVSGEGTEAATADTGASRPVKKAAAKKATKKAATKKATKKAATKKATKKSAAKKATKKAAAKKATKKSAAKKATKKAAAKKTATASTGTTAADARARLGQIPGVGPAKQDALLAQYGSLEGIRDASVDDIVANVKGFGSALASRVKDELA